MADEQSRLPDSVDAPGSAGADPEPSRPDAAQPARRPAREPGGLAPPRSATMKLPDASRDPSCVRAHDGPASPQPETTTPRGGFKPVRTTQKLGTVPAWSTAAAQGAAGAAGKEARAQGAAPEIDEPPPRSVRRSRPWAEVPDPNGAGIRVIAELEAASRDLDSVPMEPIPRLNARGRSPDSLRAAGRRAKQARSAQTDPDDSAPQKTRLDAEDDPEIEPHRISRRPGPFSTNRAAASAGYIGAALVVIGVGLWIWNASASPRPRGPDPRDNPAPATAAPVTTGATHVGTTASPDVTPPPTTTTSTTVPSSLPSAVPSSVPTLSPTPMGSAPPRGRPPQKTREAGQEIVDPWDK